MRTVVATIVALIMGIVALIASAYFTLTLPPAGAASPYRVTYCVVADTNTPLVPPPPADLTAAIEAAEQRAVEAERAMRQARGEE